MKRVTRPALLRADRPRGQTATVLCCLLLVLLFGIVAAESWFRQTYTAYHIDGRSMQTTLMDGDWVYGEHGTEPSRGDIVVVDVRSHEAFDMDNIIKRLIAVEGDTVKCEKGVVYVMREGGAYEALNEPYAHGVTHEFAPVKLSDGEIFLLGDNRSESKDSSDSRIGPFRARNIVAVVPAWAVERKSSIARWENFCRGVQNFIYDLFH